MQRSWSAASQYAPRLQQRLQQTRRYTCIFCQHRPQIKSDPPPRSRHRPSFASTVRRQHSAPRSPLPKKESLVPQTHYEFFPISLAAGPPPQGPFEIDLKALRQEFLQLQSKAHPDLHPADQKRRAEALSSRINEAYKTLQDPLRRAQYLLSLRGLDVAEDETAKVDDPDLLMEVLETRETIEEAETEDDLLPLKEINEGRIEQSGKVLEEAFGKDDLERAKEEAVKLRYWVNIKESLVAWEKGKPVVLVH
ncbi:molecular chaperone [Elasticomyces elasticus]|nr:molecular chaperone [Elasticomyces elasticus]